MVTNKANPEMHTPMTDMRFDDRASRRDSSVCVRSSDSCNSSNLCDSTTFEKRLGELGDRASSDKRVKGSLSSDMILAILSVVMGCISLTASIIAFAVALAKYLS